MQQEQMNKSILKVGFPSEHKVSFYEPTNIYVADEYIFLEAIYSTLVNLSDKKGSPEPSIAKDFYWVGSELHLNIRDDLSTVDGHKVGIDDVIFSLKRILVLSQNTHGDFKNIICPNLEIKNVGDLCDGIRKLGNTLILKPAVKQDFILPMLAAIDFAILPKSSVDPQSLRIIDYRNTSGPYYVEKDNGGGHITLNLNPHHFIYSKDLASEIHLVPTKGLSSSQVIQLFRDEQIDHTTTIQKFSMDDVNEFDRSQINIHETLHIKAVLASITEKGLKKLSVKQRLAFAKSLRKSFHDFASQEKNYKAAHQYFVSFGNGTLSDEERQKIKSVMGNAELDTSGKGIHLKNFNLKEEMIQVSYSNMPHLTIQSPGKQPPPSQASKENIPDYHIFMTDVGFLDDIGLLSYSIKTGHFGFSPEDGQAWLKDYMDTEGSKEKMAKIKQLQMVAITEGRVIPLLAAPTFAIVRKPWTLHLSELFANNQFWKIRRK